MAGFGFDSSELIVHEGALPPLLELLKSPLEKVQQQAAGALWSLSINEDNQVRIVTSNGLPSVVKLLHSTSEALQEQGAGIMRNLAIDSDNKIRIAHEGGIAPLSQLLRSPNPRIQEESCGALRNLSINGDNQLRLVQEGVLPALISLLQSHSSAVREQAVFTLRNLSAHPDNKAFMAQNGVIGAVVGLLKMISTDAQVKEQAAVILRNLSSSTEGETRIMKEGAVPQIVTLLRSQDDVIQEQAAVCIRNLALRSSNVPSLVAEGCVPPLIILLRSHQKKVREHAAGALHNLAASGDTGRARVAAEGALPPFISLLRDSNARVQEQAIGALIHLAATVSSEGEQGATSPSVRILQEGGLAPLVELLESSDSHVVSLAAAALRVLSFTKEARASIVTQGAIAPLLRAVQSGVGGDRARAHAAATMRNLSTVEGSDSAFLYEQGIGGLVTYLHSNVQNFAEDSGREEEETGSSDQPSAKSYREEVVIHIVGILRNLSFRKENVERMTADGVVRPVIDLLKATSRGVLKVEDIRRIQAQCECLLLLRNLCASKDVQAQVLAEGGAMPLVKAMREGHSIPVNAVFDKEEGAGGSLDKLTLSTLAVATLRNVALLPQNRLPLAEFGVLPILVGILQQDNYKSQEQSCSALHVFSRDSQTRGLVVQEGTIQVLVPLLSSEIQRIKAEAIAVIRALSSDEENGGVLTREGTMKPLVKALTHSDTALVLNAVTTVRNLSVREEAKHTLVAEGAVSALSLLLSSEDADAALQAAIALRNLSSDVANLPKIIADGAVSRLIALLENPREAMVEAAAVTLCNACSVEENEAVLLSEGALPPLCALLRSPNAVVSEAAAGALRNLTASPTARKAVATEGVIPSLLALLRSPNEKAVTQAATALRNLSIDAGADSRIVSEGGISPLLGVLKNHAWPEAQAAAAATVRNLSVSPENKPKLQAKGAMSALMPLLRAAAPSSSETGRTSEEEERARSITAEIQEHASVAVRNLSMDSAQEDRVVEEGGLPSLISMLRLEKSAEKSTEQALVVLRNLSLTSAGNCKRIAAEGGVRPVLSLLQADKEQLQEHALVIVVAMAEAAPDIRAQIVTEGGIKLLLPLLSFSEGSNRIHELAAACLRNLAVERAFQSSLASAGAIGPLVDLVNNSKAGEVIDQAIGALRNLTLHSENESLAMQTGVIAAAIQLARSYGGSVQANSIACLRNLSVKEEAKLKIVQGGGLAPVIEALRLQTSGETTNSSGTNAGASLAAGISDTAENAIVTLRNLSSHEYCQGRMVSEGALEPLFEILRSRPSSGGPFDGHLALILRNLSAIKGNEERLGSAGGSPGALARALVPLLQSRDKFCQTHAAATLRNLSSLKECRAALLAREPLEALVKACSAASDETQPEALAVLRNLTSPSLSSSASAVGENGGNYTAENDVEAKRAAAAVVEAGAIPAIIGALYAPLSSAKREALCTLRNLSLHTAHRRALIEEGCVSPLWTIASAMSSSSEEDTAGEAARLKRANAAAEDIACALTILRNLSLCRGQEVKIATNDGIATVLELLRAPPPSLNLAAGSPGAVQLQCLAAGIVGSLSTDDRLEVRLVDEGALPPLVSMLRSGALASRAEAATTLRNLSVHPENKVALVQEGAIPPLVAILKEATEGELASKGEEDEAGTGDSAEGHNAGARGIVRECTLSCLTVLRNLAVNAANKAKIAIGANALPPLIDFLRRGSEGDNVEIAAAAGAVLQNLCVNAEVKERAVESGILPPLSALLSTQWAAASEQSHETDTEREGSGSDGRTLVAIACGILRNLSIAESNKAKIVATGIIAAVVRLLVALRSDEAEARRQASTVEHCTVLFRNLSTSEDNRRVIAGAGGVGPLVGALRLFSSMPEPVPQCGQIIEQTCGALQNLSVREENKVKIVGSSGVAVLLSIIRSPDQYPLRALEEALGTLRNLTAAKEALGQEAETALRESVAPLVALISPSSGSKAGGVSTRLFQSGRAAEHALVALRNLTLAEEGAKAAVETGLLPPLIHLLRTNCSPFASAPVSSSVASSSAGGTSLALRAVEHAAVILRNVSSTKSCLAQVVRTGDAVDATLPLLQSPLEAVQEAAASSLCNIAATANTSAAAGVDPAALLIAGGAVPQSLLLLRSPNGAVRVQASALLRNLSVAPAALRHIVGEGGLSSVAALLKNPIGSDREKDHCQMNAAIILRNVSQDGRNDLSILHEEGLVYTLVSVALRMEGLLTEEVNNKEEQLAIVETSFGVLRNLSTSPTNRAKLQACNVAEPVAYSLRYCSQLSAEERRAGTSVRALVSTIAEHSCVIARNLLGLSSTWDLAFLREKSAIAPLVALLRGGDEQLQENVAAAFRNLSCAESSQVQKDARESVLSLIGSSGVLPALLSLLQSPSEAVRAHASVSLRNLSASVDSEEAAIVDGAAEGSLAGEAKARSGGVDLIAEGGLGQFVAMLGAQSLEEKENAIISLRNLSVDFSNVPSIVREGAIPALTKLITNSSSEDAAISPAKQAALQEHALVCLRNISAAADGKFDPDLLDAEVLDRAVALLKSPQKPVQEQAAGLLRNLLAGDVARMANSGEATVGARVLSLRGLLPLLSLLRSTERAVQEQAAGALRNLCLAKNACRQLIEEEGLSPLLGILRTAETLLTAATAQASSEAQLRAAAQAAGVIRAIVRFNEFREKAVLEGVLPPLAVCAASTNDHLRKQCLGSLCSLTASSTEDNCRAALLREGVLPSLIAALRSEDPEVAELAAAVVGNLTFEEGGEARLLREGGVASLLGVLERGTERERALGPERSRERERAGGDASGRAELTSLATLRNLSAKAENAKKIVNEGGVTSLLPYLRSFDTRKVDHAVACLRNLSLFAESELLAVAEKDRAGDSSNGVASLVGLLRSEDPRTRQEAVAALRNLTSAPRARVTKAKEELTKSQKEGGESTSASATSAAAYAPTEGTAVLSTTAVESGAVPHLVELLRQNDEKVQEGAVSALQNIAASGKEACELMIQEGALPQIVSLLRSSSVLAVQYAAGALRNVCLHRELHAAVTEANAITPLTAVLASASAQSSQISGGPTARAKEMVLGTLLNLCATDEIMLKVAEGGAARAAASLLRAALTGGSEAPAVHELASALLMNLSGAAGSPTPRSGRKEGTDEKEERPPLPLEGADLVAEGVLPALIACLSSPVPRARENALQALTSLCHISADNRVKMVSEEGVRPLLDLLNAKGETGGKGSLKLSILSLLRSLSSQPKNKDVMVEKGILPHMVSYLSSPSRSLQEQAVLTIRNLSVNEVNEVKIVEAGAVRPLIEMLQTSDPRMQELSASALRNISVNAGNKKKLSDEGAIPPLARLLDSKDEKIQEQVAVTIRNLSVDSVNEVKLVEAGVLPGLVRLLRSPNEKVVRQVAGALANLSVAPSNKPKIVSAGGLPLLIGLLKSPSERIVEHAAGAIRNLSMAHEIESQIVNGGGVGPLIELLRVKDKKIAVQAAIAIRNLSVPTQNKKLLADAGAVSPLVMLLTSSEKKLQEQAVITLRNLSVPAENKVHLVQEGVLLPLVSLLKPIVEAEGAQHEQDKRGKEKRAPVKLDSTIRKIAEFAAGTIRNISVSSELQKSVLDAGIVRLFVALLEKAPREAKLIEQCTSTLRNLAVDEATAATMVGEEKVVPPLVVLLRFYHTGAGAREVERERERDKERGREGTDASRVLEQVAGAIRNLSMSSSQREALIGAGVLPPMIELLNHADAKVAEQAGIALRNLSEGVED